MLLKKVTLFKIASHHRFIGFIHAQVLIDGSLQIIELLKDFFSMSDSFSIYTMGVAGVEFTV